MLAESHASSHECGRVTMPQTGRSPSHSATPATPGFFVALPLSRFGGTSRFFDTVFNTAAFGLDFANAAAVFEFHDLVAQKRCSLILEAGRSDLHLFF